MTRSDSQPRDWRPDVRGAYDAVAERYDAQLGCELDDKPLDRAMLCAFAELVGRDPVADVGCGPGHVTRYLAATGTRPIGIDLSPRMIEFARRRAPEVTFEVASMLALPASDGAWAGAVSLYSIIHLDADDRAAAWRELGRVIRPAGVLLVAFHVESESRRTGDTDRVQELLGTPVQLDTHYLDPGEVEAELLSAGFRALARLVREPVPDVEYPSRRCYSLLIRQ